MVKQLVNLKQWRKSKRLTQGEIAKLVGYKSSMTVSYWERQGIKNTDIINKLKLMSKNKINDFTGNQLEGE